MLHLLKIVGMILLGTWGVLRAAEEGFGLWVRRATRPRGLGGVAWA